MVLQSAGKVTARAVDKLDSIPNDHASIGDVFLVVQVAEGMDLGFDAIHDVAHK